MEYFEGSIKNTEFFTTTELAEKLKMNVQVITRKIQSGEIRAYKIGKDWRVPEKSVYTWLEGLANDQKVKETGNRRTVRKAMEQVVKQTEKRNGNRRFLLDYILAQFDPHKKYSEAEVDRVIERYHHDFRAVRREFITEQMMEQQSGSYQRRADYSLTRK